MAKKKKPRKIPDPIVGEVAGNVLDEYSSFSYSAKLYMIPPEAELPAGTKPSSGGRQDPGVIAKAAQAFKTTTPSNPDPTRGGFLYGHMSALPEETVVLAQSGVTAGNMIDNIQIENISKFDTGFETRTINFQIKQPGAANFLDQILLARKRLGIPTFATDCPLFLEIMFQGYDEDLDDNDEGAQPYSHGPYRWRMHLAQVSLNVTGEGSEYDVQCVPASQVPYQDQFFRMPKNLSTSGDTISEHLADLITGIREHHENNNDKYQIRDTIGIDLSGLIGENGLKEEKLNTRYDAQSSMIANLQFNPGLEDMDIGQIYKEHKKLRKDEDSQLNIAVYKDTINVKKGISLYDYLCVLLSMNTEFFERATRSVLAESVKAHAEDKNSNKFKKKDAYTKWLKINADTEYKGFDQFRNVYAKKVIFRPTLFDSVDDRVQANPEENQLTKEETQARINELSSSVFKSYHYLFSGRNDQIYSCNIEYDNGIAFLLPPAGGTIGDVSVTGADLLADRVPLNKDISGGNLTKAVLEAKNNKNVNDFYNNATDADIRSLGGMLGLNNQELKDAVENKNSVAALKIKDLLNNRALLDQLTQAESRAEVQKLASRIAQTVSDTVNVRGSRASGFIYSGDLIGDINNQINAETLWAKARQRGREIGGLYENAEMDFNPFVPGVTKIATVKEGKDPTDSLQPPVQQLHIVNELGEASFDGTPRQNLIGYYMQQKMEPSFLVKLDMEVKGDPWYLGKPDDGSSTNHSPQGLDTDESNEDYVVFDKKDNVILFDMQSPRLFDFDVDDEDNNEGYWSADGTAYFISGVYMLVKAVSKFEGGEFKQDISLVKLTSYQTSKIDKSKNEAVDQHKARTYGSG